MGFWRQTDAGREYSRVSSEYGVHIDGPLTVDDWKKILEDIVDEIAEQAKREASEGSR
jgi:hypothetical protein